MYLASLGLTPLFIVGVFLSIAMALWRLRRFWDGPLPVRRRLRELLDPVLLRLASVAHSLRFALGAWSPPALPKLARVAAWAVCLLAPGVAFADTATTGGFSLSGIETMVLGIFSGGLGIGGIVFALLKKEAPALADKVNQEVDVGEQALEGVVGRNAWLKNHQQDSAALIGALRMFTGLVKASVIRSGADLSVASALNGALLTKVEDDVKDVFLGRVNKATLLQILINAGILTPGASLWDFFEGELASIVHGMAESKSGAAATVLGFIASMLANSKVVPAPAAPAPAPTPATA